MEDPDLQRAKGFVVKRIEEEARLSGEPLEDQELVLLNNLPTSPVGDLGQRWGLGTRDYSFEKLCRIAKAALSHDEESGSAKSEWEFTVAVLTLHNDPMLWLLRYGGLKQELSWTDRLLLIAAGIFVCVVMFFVGWLQVREPETRMGKATFIGAFLSLVASMYFASRHFQVRRLKRIIDRWRPS